MEKLKDILRESGMSTRPEYYSGRGATRSDLDSSILGRIYDGILKEYGKRPANYYVKMVADIKVLSATTFLQELYMLFNNNWKYITVVPENICIDDSVTGIENANMHNSFRDGCIRIINWHNENN